MNSSLPNQDTICALATAGGTGPIAVIRLSGNQAFSITDKVFNAYKKDVKISESPSHTIHLGQIGSGENTLDEVLVSVFKNPNSYTGEDVVEISCHGSLYIQQRILQVLIDNGARPARPGEYTMRAFLNGKMDLSQAEAVADLIVSNSKASHKLAYSQMRGHFSKRIGALRQQLLDFASLIELELDFSEEDVEFASRAKLKELLMAIKAEIKSLISSFSVGNVMKNGIPVAIIGKPNVGKSTLLNVILNEDKALVSDIPGTTRDAIEDTIVIEGIAFRFIDTAGLRHSEDVVENMGMERTLEKVKLAEVVLYLFDITETTVDEVIETLHELKDSIGDPDKKFILIANKTDLLEEVPRHFRDLVDWETIFISAKRRENINLITDSLLRQIMSDSMEENTAIVSNTRHYEALSQTLHCIKAIKHGLESNIHGDLLASDLRQALYYLGSITGEVSTDEILGNIFGKFCIGK